jgi:hypothetical protein
MKMTAKLFRCAEFRTADVGATSAEAQAEVAKRGIPRAHGFKVFWGAAVSVAAMEAMAFVVGDAHVPQSGLVQADPLIPEHIHRLDGALQAALMGFGVYTECEAYQWRMMYETEGN